MGNENGKWIMYGVDEHDQYRIKSVPELVAYINEVGFLPLFKNTIPGFSVENRTLVRDWWSGDVERDPWEWREIIAAGGQVAYGKFFDKKAGFISLHWLPYGWPIAVYTIPETVWGYDLLSSAYGETPEASEARVYGHIQNIYPVASAEQIHKLLK